MKVQWDESYSVGVREMDKQHQRLFEIINEYADALEQNHAPETLMELLNQLKDFTHWHFNEEEKYFRVFRYVDADVHIMTHAKLIDRIFEYIEKIKSGETIADQEIVTFLNSWLTYHIKGTDKQYMECFNQNGLV
ncbi:MAG: hemerythrin family protein [Candidatus Marinimicrobia bacterium]|nr:hemerythrin family protein [Candidatus Neomarinimicrobiota bacterium]